MSTSLDGAAPSPAPSASTAPDAAAPASSSRCPEGMIYVDTMHCTDIERRCVDDEYDKQNRLTICHRSTRELLPLQDAGGAPPVLHRRVRVPEQGGRTPGHRDRLVPGRSDVRVEGQAPLLGERVDRGVRGTRRKEDPLPVRLVAKPRHVQHRQLLRRPQARRQQGVRLPVEGQGRRERGARAARSERRVRRAPRLRERLRRPRPHGQRRRVGQQRRGTARGVSVGGVQGRRVGEHVHPARAGR